MLYQTFPYMLGLLVGTLSSLLVCETARGIFKIKRFQLCYMTVYAVLQIVIPPLVVGFMFTYSGVMPGWNIVFSFFYSVIFMVFFVLYPLLYMFIRTSRGICFSITLVMSYLLSFSVVFSNT